MDHPKNRQDDRFAQEVDRVLADQPVTGFGDQAYQADLGLVQRLNQMQVGPTPHYQSQLRRRLLNKLHEKEARTMSPMPILRSLVRTALVAGLAAVVVLGVVFVVSPDVRAAAQELFARFAEVDSPWALLPAPEGAEVVPTEPDMSGLAQSPGTNGYVTAPSGVAAPPLPGGSAAPSSEMLVSLKKAQAAVSFTIKAPKRLPQGYKLKGALKPAPAPELPEALPADGPITTLPSAVLLVYENKEGSILTLSESMLPTLEEVDVALPAGPGSVQEVMVNGQPGQYVSGAWSRGGWDANASHHQLQWQGTDGVTYDLFSQQLGLEDLLAIAESIQ